MLTKRTAISSSKLTLFKKLFAAVVFATVFGTSGFAQDANKDAKNPAVEKAPAVSAAAAGDKADDGKKAVEPFTIEVAEILSRATRSYDTLRSSLLASAKIINSPNAPIDGLIAEKSNIDGMQAKIISAKQLLKKPIADFSERLAQLGPAPKKGKTESKAIADQRALFTKITEDLNAAQKKFDLLELEASQTSANASSRQKTAFVQRVFIPQKSIFNPKLWAEFTPTVAALFERSFGIARSWHKPASEEGKLSGATSYFAVIFIFLLEIVVAGFLWKKMAYPPIRIGPANNLRRLWRTVGGTLAIAILSFIFAVLAESVLSSSTVTDLRIFRITAIIGIVIGVSVVMMTLHRATAAPANNQWRLIDFSDGAALKINRLGLFAIAVFSLDQGLTAFGDVVFLPLAFVIGTHAITSILLIILVSMMITTMRNAQALDHADETGVERAYYFGWLNNFFLIGWGFVFVAGLALLFGFVSFAHFLMTKLVITSALVAGLYLLHNLVDALVVTAMQPRSAIGKTFRDTMGLQDLTIQRLGLVLSTITDFAVVIIGLPIILTLWAITWIDLSSLTSSAFFGFKIGDVTVEPSRIMLAIFMLIIGVLLVRLFTVWLNKRILDRSSVDPGVKNSITTGAKYTGILLVAGFALSAAGLDFSKLAIVAGALSVGIGFGLQSVVSNFVSGLILLAERPIRIGDWIQVSGGEGTVKKINVRSTEILTFDRCAVIIPNSSLISEPVINWSHGSPIGRIKVNIGVGYDSDPQEVEKILLKCAHANEWVIPAPAPRVMFMDFGASSLDFQLRIFLADIGDCTIVASQLRFAIFKELKEAGIEIPFPQRDINIRGAEQLAESFSTATASQKTSQRKTPTRKSPANK